MVLCEFVDDGLQVRSLGEDLREQAGVLAAVVAAERRAETAAEHQQVHALRHLDVSVDRLAGERHRLAQAPVYGSEPAAEGDQPVGL
ncbi:hypothetical protein GCM10029992_17980 [Glycomyces albus]